MVDGGWWIEHCVCVIQKRDPLINNKDNIRQMHPVFTFSHSVYKRDRDISSFKTPWHTKRHRLCTFQGKEITPSTSMLLIN
jgi:hypothetical protein